jgi:hypothetical protein
MRNTSWYAYGVTTSGQGTPSRTYHLAINSGGSTARRFLSMSATWHGSGSSPAIWIDTYSPKWKARASFTRARDHSGSTGLEASVGSLSNMVPPITSSRQREDLHEHLRAAVQPCRHHPTSPGTKTSSGRCFSRILASSFSSSRATISRVKLADFPLHPLPAREIASAWSVSGISMWIYSGSGSRSQLPSNSTRPSLGAKVM